jgi:hypothetical protein
MRAEELDNLTEAELIGRATKLLELAQSPLDEPPEFRDDAVKLRAQLEAQFCLSAVARKRDDRTAKRDFRMEVAVIALISVEIILSIVFGLLALHEGSQQAKVLSHMDASAAATAAAMTDVKTALQVLADEQTKSSDSLREMNDSLQSSAGAARNQLHILQQEQADTLAQRSKKPKLGLVLGGYALDSMRPPPKVIARAETDTSMTLDFLLLNSGSATAHAAIIRVLVWDKEVGLQGEGTLMLTAVPPTGVNDRAQVYTAAIGNLRDRNSLILPLTFTFPKGHKTFGVTIYADADEIETGTPLATLDISPGSP